MPRSKNKGALVTVWNCAACGARCERKPARGQIPKWCDDCRTGGVKKQITCGHCGETCWTWHSGKYCSRSCASAAIVRPELRPKPPPKTQAEIEAGWRAQRAPLRAAYEDRDWRLVLELLKQKASVDDITGCWNWHRLDRSGYPSANFGRLHRVSLEAKMRAPLGSQAAHHICANTACVNPEHLQPVTHRDNVAEMLARQSYVARIRELEAALAQSHPGHPLLDVVTVA